MDVVLTPIGFVRSDRSDPVDDYWGGTVSVIELDSTMLEPSATLGLEQFSHVEVVFLMHQVAPEAVVTGARRPRGNEKWPLTGILAQRAKARPNRIGISRARVRSVQGLRVEVEELDATDGTPVLDIKPLIREFLPKEEIVQPRWATELMKHYYCRVGDLT